MNKQAMLMILLLSAGSLLFAQDDNSKTSLLSRIFLPSIDFGYQIPNSTLIEGAVRFSTSIEYRFKNNNDFFVRLSYDTYNPRYSLSQSNTTSNTIDGSANMTDALFGPGYRFGDNTFRMMIAVMPGVKMYEFPTASLDGSRVIVSQEAKQLFTTVALATLEYYFDHKSAFTISISQNSVWKKVDFWADGTSAVSFSLGFITSLL